MTVLGHFVRLGRPASRVDGAVGQRPIQKGHAGTDRRGKPASIKQQGDPAQTEDAEVEKGGFVARRAIRQGHRVFVAVKAVDFGVDNQAQVSIRK